MKHVLIVDDDPMIIDFVSKELSDMGHDYEFITNSNFLFPVLESKHFDLILLDVHLPNHGGVSLLEKLKDHSLHLHIPVIMLTADTNRDLFIQCFELGAVDFINKPIERVILKARMQSAFAMQDFIREIEKQKELLQASNRQLKAALEKQKVTEDELFLSQKRLMRILDFLDDAVISSNKEGRITFCNQQAEALLGYDAEEMLNRSLSTIFPNWEDFSQDQLESKETSSVSPDLNVSNTLNQSQKIQLQLAPKQYSDEIQQEIDANLFYMETEGEQGYVLAFGQQFPKVINHLPERLQRPANDPERLQQLENLLLGLPSLLTQTNRLLLQEIRHSPKRISETPASSPFLSQEELQDLPKDKDHALVHVMVLSLQFWERNTQKNKVDLAQESGIWSAHLDKVGNFRTTTLNRYLKVQTLPKKPRWRDVLQTGYFVLKCNAEDTPLRKELESNIAHLEKLLR